jgi:23S rRNA G2445 N2-methylase RlmL
MTRCFALTTRGLEAISAAELGDLPGVTVCDIAYRRVLVTCDGALDGLLQARTVDDVFLHAATWSGVGHTRAELSALRAWSQALDLRALAEVRGRALGAARAWRRPAVSFSVTANFVGRRNYTTDEIKQLVAAAVAASHGWAYTPDDAEADLNVRVFMEHETAWVGVRLGTHPLHRRPYKHAHVLGSLKPPVAAALLHLAGVAPGMRVLDPCCGAGTVLVEAAQQQARSFGGDLAVAALAAAGANVTAAGARAGLARWDAQALPLADASVARVVSNPPWGRAVTVDAALKGFYRRLCGEIGRVLAPGGRAVLLTGVPALVDFAGLQLITQFEISLYGQTPVVFVYGRA